MIQNSGFMDQEGFGNMGFKTKKGALQEYSGQVEMGDHSAAKRLRLDKGVMYVRGGPGDDGTSAGTFYAKNKSDPLQAFFHEMFLDIPITHQTLCLFADNNFVVPFNFILFRPNMTYDMSSGICMKTGSGTGETLIGHSDFSLGDNVVRKVYYGNFTMYSRAVVYNHRHCFLAEDMMSTKYCGGNDCNFKEKGRR
jgi:hypothetical protein